jgi:type II secretory pathway predicted ATPase ExeA
MYETHYGLSGRPFAIAPDPDFYFASTTGERALAYLRYAALEGSSLVVVTGAIGVGKTMLVQTLQRRLEPRSIAVAQLIGPRLGADDLPRALVAAFGLTAASGEPQAALQAHLAALAAEGRRALLVVDDAHELPGDTLHALLRLPTAAIQLALVGQPGLRARLQQDASAVADHGVDVVCHLAAFEPAETAAYIEHRLRRVGWEQRPAIPAPAREAIQRATGGVPLRVNRLCDRLLFTACLDELDTIPAALVERVDGELHVELDAVQTQCATGVAAHADSATLGPGRLSIPTLVSVIENARPLTRVEPALYAAPATARAARQSDEDADEDARDDSAARTPRPQRAALRTPAAGLLGAAAVAALIAFAAYRDNAPPVLHSERASPTPADVAVSPPSRSARPTTNDSPRAATPLVAPPVAPSATAARPEPAPPTVEALTSASPSGAGPVAPATAPPAPGALGSCTDAIDALGLCTAPGASDRHPTQTLQPSP